MRLAANHLRFLFLFVAILAGQSPTSAQGVFITPVFTLPSCTEHRYAVPMSTESAEKLSGPQGNFFCVDSDFSAASRADSGPMTALKAAVGNQAITSLSLSAYIITEQGFADWVCHLTYARGATITVLTQRKPDGSGQLSGNFASALDTCPVAPKYIYYGCSVFDDDAETHAAGDCRKGGVNTLHLKSLQMQFADSSTLSLLGSGNFNRSLYANIEDWLLIRTDSSPSELASRIQCVFAAAAANSSTSPDAKAIGRDWDSCMSNWGSSPSEANIFLEFAPIQGTQFRTRLIDALKNAERIDIAAQSLEDPDLISAISGNPGAVLRIVVDDDWYWAQRNQGDFYTARYDKIKWITKLDRAVVRYLQTNHAGQGGLGNTLHTRYIQTTRNGVKTVFTGSAHLRPGSFQLNVEHLLTISDTDLTNRYTEFFNSLWQRGMAWSHLPLVDAPILSP